MGVPTNLHRYFWEVDRALLDTDHHRRYIIERLFEKGNIGALKWALSTFSKKNIIDVIKHSRSLSRKCGNFWALYFHIDPKELRCMQKPFPALPATPWNR